MARKRKKAVDKQAYKEQKTIIILAEGETEKNYLMYLRYLYNKSMKLKIINKSKLTKDIRRDIHYFAEIFKVEPEEIVLLYDLENSRKEYDKFIYKNKLRHKNTYLVQPCVEIHFLMHYRKGRISNNQRISPDAVIRRLKRYNNYQKGLRYNWHKNGVGFKEVERAKVESIRHFRSLKDKSFSMIGKLIVDHFQ